MKAIPAMRIWPMSDKVRGFRGKSLAQVQADCFGRDLPKAGGVFSYRSAGLHSPAGTVVLFQFQARIIASAVLLRDEKFKSPRAGRRGRLHFDASSIRTFEPLDLAAMRQIWPGIRPFGHVKQVLNPTLYAKFCRRLKGIRDRERDFPMRSGSTPIELFKLDIDSGDQAADHPGNDLNLFSK